MVLVGWCKETSVSIENDTFDSNFAVQTLRGSVLYFSNVWNISITNNSSFCNNKGVEGTVYCSNCTQASIMDSSNFENNSVSGNGGVLYLQDCPFSLSSSTFSNNTANLGGSLSFTSSKPTSTLSISSSNFFQNNAVNGGALYLNISQKTSTFHSPLLSLKNSTFSLNSATSKGGSVFANFDSLNFFSSSTTLLNLCDLHFNKSISSDQGGALFLQFPMWMENTQKLLNISSCFFSTCCSKNNGSAISLHDTLSQVSEDMNLSFSRRQHLQTLQHNRGPWYSILEQRSQSQFERTEATTHQLENSKHFCRL